MQLGALALFDALGFKGIWRREDPRRVVDKLRGLKEHTEGDLDERFGGKKYREGLHRSQTNALKQVRSVFLSDTIALTTVHKSAGWVSRTVGAAEARRRGITREEGRAGEAMVRRTVGLVVPFLTLDVTATAAGAVVAAALRTKPFLAFRGALSFGKFDIDSEGRFLVGPAIDDAAEHHELAQGAFLWLTPAALKALGPEFLEHFKKTDFKKTDLVQSLISYAVPQGRRAVRDAGREPIRRMRNL